MPAIHVAAFVNYFLAALSSVIANGIIIVITLKMAKNGEYKWVFMGLAIADLLLSLSVLTLSLNINFTVEGNLIIYSENLLIGLLGPHFCSFVFKIIFQWQTCAVFWYISLISINRYMYICIKPHWALTERFWICTVIGVQLATLLLNTFPFIFTTSGLTNIPSQINETLDSNRIFCVFMDSSSEQQKLSMNTIFIVGALSYVITIFCVFRLVGHLRKSFHAVRTFGDRNSVKQQKSTLAAIAIQAFSPLLCVVPVFVVTALKTGSNDADT